MLRWPVQGWQLVARHLDLTLPGRGARRQDPGSGDVPAGLLPHSLSPCPCGDGSGLPTSRCGQPGDASLVPCAAATSPRECALLDPRFQPSTRPAGRRIRPPRVAPWPYGRRVVRAARPRPAGAVLPPSPGMLFLEGFGRFLGHCADGGNNCFFDLSAASNGASIYVPHRPPLPAGCSMMGTTPSATSLTSQTWIAYPHSCTNWRSSSPWWFQVSSAATGGFIQEK
ncbi:unnamed protein product [Urochloa humidicola]